MKVSYWYEHHVSPCISLSFWKSRLFTLVTSPGLIQLVQTSCAFLAIYFPLLLVPGTHSWAWNTRYSFALTAARLRPGVHRAHALHRRDKLSTPTKTARCKKNCSRKVWPLPFPCRWQPAHLYSCCAAKAEAKHGTGGKFKNNQTNL